MFKLLQMTLDFFGPVESVQKPEHEAPPTQVPFAAPAARFVHPRANREVRIGNALVAYEFTRVKRRTIGFSVGPEGLVVRAPRWVSVADVQSALLEKSGWIVRKLEETRERRARLESSRIDWQDGVEIPFLGQPVRLVLDPAQRHSGAAALLQQGEPADGGMPPLSLHLGLPQWAAPEQIRDATQAWLMRQARRIFIERLDHFAPKLGVQWRKLALSSAGTRWGSARADGAIRLHWRLVHFRMEVIDYVVAHELSHLRVMDHSPRFWDTVGSVVPHYAQLKGQLKDESIPQWN
ncbi:MAG: SprT family zinc-dependent metalloprotease [Burkholderiaceae bacterium]